MIKTNVIVADDNVDLTLMISEFLKVNDFNVLETFKSGTNLLNYLKRDSNNEEVDLLLLDIFMPEKDGITVLNELKNTSKYIKPKKIIILSAFNNENLISKASELGADYFIIKPINLNTLLPTINSVLNQGDQTSHFEATTKKTTADNLEKNISYYLHNIGILSHLKGYNFLRTAIVLVYNDYKMIDSITKKLYPTIAEKYNTTNSRVERAIRHAIEVAWKDSKNEEYINTTLKPMISFDKKPTNGEFIASFADLLRFDSFEK